MIKPISELDAFVDGALQERVSVSLSQIVANIQDLNTKPDAKRSLVITMTIKPSKSRREASVTTKVQTRLAPLEEIETMAQIGMDDTTGEMVMVEVSDVIPGQVDMSGEEHTPNVARFPGAAR